MTDTPEKRVEQRQQRQKMMINTAKVQERSITYIDDDGCEVTVTPSGHVFYNMADWY